MFITVVEKSQKIVATVGRQDYAAKRYTVKKPGRQLFNDFEPLQRLPNTPFNMSGRPRAMSVDSSCSSLNSTITPTELQLAIASIVQSPEAPDCTTDEIDGTGVTDVSNVQSRQQRHLSSRRSSFNPSLPTIAEEDDEDVLQFIDTLFR